MSDTRARATALKSTSTPALKPSPAAGSTSDSPSRGWVPEVPVDQTPRSDLESLQHSAGNVAVGGLVRSAGIQRAPTNPVDPPQGGPPPPQASGDSAGAQQALAAA